MHQRFEGPRRLGHKVYVRSRRYLRSATNALETVRRTPWPVGVPESAAPNLTAALVVSYNTVELTNQLLYSLHASGIARALAELVVVDNGSRDGSLEYLRAVRDRHLITLIENRWPPYHGPGLNRGMSHLARGARAGSIEYVWILDSDVVVLRPDTLTDAVRVARDEHAAIVGPWPFSMVLDPRRAWRKGLPPFYETGRPAEELQLALTRDGQNVVAFPFESDGYVFHVGGGTLRKLLDDGVRGNVHVDWLRAKNGTTGIEAFDSERARPAAYELFLERFDGHVGRSDPPDFASKLAELG